MSKLTPFLLLLLARLTIGQDDCNLPQTLIDEIQSYQTVVNQIIDATTNGQFKGKTYDELAVFVDKFGPRLQGSKNLEDSIDYLLQLFQEYKLDNVHGEEVLVLNWVRGSESARLIEPRQTNIPILALGSSVGTPTEGIEAEVVVVESAEDLDKNYSESVKGKIVLFNNEYISYSASVVYRYNGASLASKYGAVATLIRSVTPFSMDLPHTGRTTYDENFDKIPAAAITVEHANMFQRMQDRGETIKLRLNIETQNLITATSRNTVAEVQGSEKPEQVVIVSGHLDSWDVGVGAMDDGGGVFISWYALVVLKSLGLTAKRTVRAVLWTAEENGMGGVNGYNEAHKDELKNFKFVMESDEGTFTPRGLAYVAGRKGGCIIQEIVKLLAPINATRTVKSNSVGSDIALWKDVIPTGSLLNANEEYFWYHHTKADTMDVMDPDALDKSTALWASVAYVIANLNEDFPSDFSDSAFSFGPNIFYIMFVTIISNCLMRISL